MGVGGFYGDGKGGGEMNTCITQSGGALGILIRGLCGSFLE